MDKEFANLFNTIVLGATTRRTRNRCIRSRRKTVVILVRSVAHAPPTGLHTVADMLQTVEYNTILRNTYLQCQRSYVTSKSVLKIMLTYRCLTNIFCVDSKC